MKKLDIGDCFLDAFFIAGLVLVITHSLLWALEAFMVAFIIAQTWGMKR